MRCGWHGEELTHHGPAHADRRTTRRSAAPGASRPPRPQTATRSDRRRGTDHSRVLDRAKTDNVIGRTKVVDLLKSLPGYGPAKVTALMKQTGIVSSRRAAGLGDRQRQALTDALT
jgi:hypothetical protein